MKAEGDDIWPPKSREYSGRKARRSIRGEDKEGWTKKVGTGRQNEKKGHSSPVDRCGMEGGKEK